MKARFQKRVKDLLNVDPPHLWNVFENGILKARNEACRKKKNKRNRGSTYGGMRR